MTFLLILRLIPKPNYYVYFIFHIIENILHSIVRILLINQCHLNFKLYLMKNWEIYSFINYNNNRLANNLPCFKII
jgi:hypothetical protein